MYCIHCGKSISQDSSFCPYCGKNQKTSQLGYCKKCGQSFEIDSLFCPYCGEKQESSKEEIKRVLVSWQVPHVTFKAIFRNRFFICYILWTIVNSLLLSKSKDAYSNYFNSTNVSPDHWMNSDKGIYPGDWFYPFRNIFSGIMGQDPIYVYDISEFIIYVVILPILVGIVLYKRENIFKSTKKSCLFYWIVWYISLWMLIVFPMGFFSLDPLGWCFMIGCIVVCIAIYQKYKSLSCPK